MSWLARSIANSLKLDDGDDDNAVDDRDGTNVNAVTDSKSPKSVKSDQHSPSSLPSTPRGVKEDISELTKTLTRQFWGVASFLAPPPDAAAAAPPPPPPPRKISDEAPSDSEEEASDEDLIAGIRSDFAEIGGKFKTGISKLSTNATVTEITKIASNFLQFGAEREVREADLIGSAVGVTEEVVAFARDLAMHPGTWLDFPVPDHDDFEDFDMSDAQQEHALAVEQLAPRLAALRLELCPEYMSEGCFWKIYFVLLHPRLAAHDAELLSTPQIVKTRTMLSHEFQSQAKAKYKQGWSGVGTSVSEDDLSHEETLSVPVHGGPESVPLKPSSNEVVLPTVAAKPSGNEAIISDATSERETEKHPVQSTEMQIIDKAVVEEEPINQKKHQELSSDSSSRAMDEKFEDDTDDWLKEGSSEMTGASGTTLPLGNDEDVSFSDLEEDDEDVPISYKKETSGSDNSTKDSRDWVQLSRSSADSAKDINPVSVKHAGSVQVSARNSEAKESNDWLDVDDVDVM